MSHIEDQRCKEKRKRFIKILMRRKAKVEMEFQITSMEVKRYMANISSKDLLFGNVVYEKPEVIQGLLRFYYDFKSQAQEDFTEELLCIYVDLDRALEKIKITDRQREALSHYMEGWTEEEIGKKMGDISHQAVHKLVVKVCVKVSEYLGVKDDK